MGRERQRLLAEARAARAAAEQTARAPAAPTAAAPEISPVAAADARLKQLENQIINTVFNHPAWEEGYRGGHNLDEYRHGAFHFGMHNSHADPGLQRIVQEYNRLKNVEIPQLRQEQFEEEAAALEPIEESDEEGDDGYSEAPSREEEGGVGAPAPAPVPGAPMPPPRLPRGRRPSVSSVYTDRTQRRRFEPPGLNIRNGAEGVDPAKDLFNQVVTEYGKLAASKRYPGYEKRMVAPFSRLQHLAQEGAQRLAEDPLIGQRGGIFQSAMGHIGRAGISDPRINNYIAASARPTHESYKPYLEAYDRSAIDAVGQDMSENLLRNILPHVQGSYMRGAYNSGARKEAEARAIEDTQKQFGRVSAQMRRENTRDAFQQAENQQSADLRAAEITGNDLQRQGNAGALAQQASVQERLSRAQQLGTMDLSGTARQAHNQRIINANMAKHNAHVNYPWQRGENIISALQQRPAAHPLSAGVQPFAPEPSYLGTLGNLAGLAALQRMNPSYTRTPDGSAHGGRIGYADGGSTNPIQQGAAQAVHFADTKKAKENLFQRLLANSERAEQQVHPQMQGVAYDPFQNALAGLFLGMNGSKSMTLGGQMSDASPQMSQGWHSAQQNQQHAIDQANAANRDRAKHAAAVQEVLLNSLITTEKDKSAADYNAEMLKVHQQNAGSTRLNAKAYAASLGVDDGGTPVVDGTAKPRLNKLQQQTNARMTEKLNERLHKLKSLKTHYAKVNDAIPAGPPQGGFTGGFFKNKQGLASLVDPNSYKNGLLDIANGLEDTQTKHGNFTKSTNALLAEIASAREKSGIFRTVYGGKLDEASKPNEEYTMGTNTGIVKPKIIETDHEIRHTEMILDLMGKGVSYAEAERIANEWEKNAKFQLDEAIASDPNVTSKEIEELSSKHYNGAGNSQAQQSGMPSLAAINAAIERKLHNGQP